MSRAFTREIDDAPPPPVPDRPISAARNLVTPFGVRQIEAAIAELDVQIQAVADQAKLDALRRDLRYWQARRASMEVVDPVVEPRTVRFGTVVTIERAGKVQQLQIVGEDEADPSAGKIAWTSPLARALDAVPVGDVVEFQAAGREEEIVVLAVKSG